MKQILLSCIACFLSLAAAGQNQVKELDQLFRQLHQQQAFNGNILIARDGNIIYENSFGLADITTKEPLTSKSVFNLASVTKQFTAMGIVLLQREGKLSVEDNFSKYLPELSSYKNIRVQDLITHQSGLSSYMVVMDEKWNKEVIATNEEVIALFAEQLPEVLFEPRTSWEYNNTGYVLLAEIIERVSGQPYPKFLAENIFEPLGMDQTQVILRYKNPVQVDHLTESYVDGPKDPITEPYNTKEYDYVTYLDGVYGQGRLHSTTHDLLKWDQAIWGEFLSPAERELIFTSQELSDGSDTSYAYGWYVEEHPQHGEIVYHSGDWTGYRTHIERHLDSDLTIIWLQNIDIPTTVLPREEIWEVVY